MTQPQNVEGASAYEQATDKEGSEDADSFKLKFCTVCASNNNRYTQLVPISYLVTRVI